MSSSIDWFPVQLPMHGTRFVGECCACGIPVVDNTLGSAFVCPSCLETHCQWCGYASIVHAGTFNTRRIICGDLTDYTLPPGECPNYRRAICFDCYREIGDSDVLIVPSGVMHRYDCCGDIDALDISVPYLQEQSEIMPELHKLDSDHESTMQDVIDVVRNLPKPWISDAIWRTP